MSPLFALPMVTQERPEDGQTAPAGAKRSGAPLAGANLLREEWLKARGNSSMPAVAGGTAGRSEPSTEATRTRRYGRLTVSSLTPSRTTTPTGAIRNRPPQRTNAGVSRHPCKAPVEGSGTAGCHPVSKPTAAHGRCMREIDVACPWTGQGTGPDAAPSKYLQHSGVANIALSARSRVQGGSAALGVLPEASPLGASVRVTGRAGARGRAEGSSPSPKRSIRRGNAAYKARL